MADIINGRMTAQLDGDFVVFLIGMRINKLWKPHKWLPVMAAMPKMLTELGQHPELGLLHSRLLFGFPVITAIQYWRSVDHLMSYAKHKTHTHLPAWRAFNQAVGKNGDVGIWHETYMVKAGQFETVYANMPPLGLGQAGTLVAATGQRESARGRLSVETSSAG